MLNFAPDFSPPTPCASQIKLQFRKVAEDETQPEIEQEIDKLRAQLARSESRARKANADLRDFAAMVSHDLREPLRTVGTYCEILSVRHPASHPGDNPDDGDDSALLLRYILDAVDRAQLLLTGMVEYADAEPEKRVAVPVDMEALFHEAARRVEPVAGREPAGITHDPLPMVLGDFETLVKLLRHLLDNAVKFNPNPGARVHVSAARQDQDWLFSVKDNGPGIEPAHQERVFGLFKRLHGRDFRGSGLGLSFARRALEWLGGRIWVESKPGEGSTFYVTLPSID